MDSLLPGRHGNGVTSRRVYVIDDESECRRSLENLAANLGLEAITFSTAEEFLANYRPQPTEKACAIVDYHLPGMSGLDLQIQLTAQSACLPVIMISDVANTRVVVEVMRKGAFTLLEKPVSSAAMREALDEALSVNCTALRRVDPPAEAVEKARLIRQLSPREKEVANLVATGYSNREIAGELGLSEKTIEKYRSNCVRKLQVRSSAAMVRAIVTAEVLGI